jgi:hypothetical protein
MPRVHADAAGLLRPTPRLPRLRGARRPIVATVIGLVLSGCVALPTPTPTVLPTPLTSPSHSPTGSPTVPSSETASPAATPEPPLSLELPDGHDERRVSVSVEPGVSDEGGHITVSVTSLVDARIDELVLRWPTALAETLFLAPFTPSEDRIRDGGPPLVQAWTKWVVGPGEQGEPDGTTSLGYGPLLAGATLEIPIVVSRRDEGPVAFDLQVLAGNALLTLDDGAPAELRVEVP